jgi:hypothetical protein
MADADGRFAGGLAYYFYRILKREPPAVAQPCSGLSCPPANWLKICSSVVCPTLYSLAAPAAFSPCRAAPSGQHQGGAPAVMIPPSLPRQGPGAALLQARRASAAPGSRGGGGGAALGDQVSDDPLPRHRRGPDSSIPMGGGRAAVR